MRTIDLFCGAGGLSEGFKQAGFKTILAIDSDKTALETFRKNHDEVKTLCTDISKVGKKEIRDQIGNTKIDLVIGGPPCQGFSLAGRRNPNDPRNKLVQEFLRIVSITQPKFFVIENVHGLKSMKTEKGILVVDSIKKKAEKVGYFIKPYLLNSKDYGVAQRRKRMFLVGSKVKEVDLKIRKTKEKKVLEILHERKKVPESYFLSQKLINGFLRREKENKKKGWNFGWRFLDLKGQSPTISARYYKDGAEALVRYDDSFLEGSIRKMTERECARIQSFPENYDFVGGKIKTYKQIGNAVPPKMAKAIARAIKKELKEK